MAAIIHIHHRHFIIAQLLEPPGSPMNMTLFKTPRFLVLYLLLQSEIPGRPYRRSAKSLNMHG